MEASWHSSVVVFKAANDHQVQLPVTSCFGRKQPQKQGFLAPFFRRKLENSLFPHFFIMKSISTFSQLSFEVHYVLLPQKVRKLSILPYFLCVFLQRQFLCSYGIFYDMKVVRYTVVMVSQAENAQKLKFPITSCLDRKQHQKHSFEGIFQDMEASWHSSVVVFKAVNDHRVQLPVNSCFGRKQPPKQGFLAPFFGKN